MYDFPSINLKKMTQLDKVKKNKESNCIIKKIKEPN